ncbi:hypothetical protein BDN67DRAFT_1015366 [Paxillus ammoniavirescens]|nr:hypothetical protein BDN67DRAFT_1015366 [Paxillus ammoniavirescens]
MPTKPQTDGDTSLETELDEFGLPLLPPDLDSTELGIGDMSPISTWNGNLALCQGSYVPSLPRLRHTLYNSSLTASSTMAFMPTPSAENQVDIPSVLPLPHPDSTPVPPEMFLTPLFTVLKQGSESLATGGTGNFEGTQSTPFTLQPKSSATSHLHVPISGPPAVSTPATPNGDTNHSAGPGRIKRRTIPNDNDTSTGTLHCTSQAHVPSQHQADANRIEV